MTWDEFETMFRAVMGIIDDQPLVIRKAVSLAMRFSWDEAAAQKGGR